MTKERPKVYFLVGLPATGKSTYTKEYLSKYEILSSDSFIEEYALSVNKTYNEVFSEYIETATKLLNEKLQKLIRENKSFVWDQTNLTKSVREKRLNNIPKKYIKIGMYFEKPDDVTWTKRLNRPGKIINKNILDKMQRDLQIPTKEEFDFFYHSTI